MHLILLIIDIIMAYTVYHFLDGAIPTDKKVTKIHSSTLVPIITIFFCFMALVLIYIDFF